MKYYGFTAAECMGYTRVCRPGFVVGPQQTYLVEYEALLQRERRMGGTSGVTIAPGTPIRERINEGGQQQQQHTPQPRKLDGKSRGLETVTGMVNFPFLSFLAYVFKLLTLHVSFLGS